MIEGGRSNTCPGSYERIQVGSAKLLGMRASLDQLPFDIMHQIARLLDVRSYTHLSRACHTTAKQLQDESTAKASLKVRFSHCLVQMICWLIRNSPATHILGGPN